MFWYVLQFGSVISQTKTAGCSQALWIFTWNAWRKQEWKCVP